jgi:hypothetical protein
MHMEKPRSARLFFFPSQRPQWAIRILLRSRTGARFGITSEA